MNKKYINIIFSSIIGLGLSLLIGFWFFGYSVFDVNHPAFLFLSYGFFGSLFFALQNYGTKTELYLSFPFVLIIQMAIMGSSTPDSYYLRDFLLITSLFLSVYLFTLINNKVIGEQKSIVYRALVFSVLYSFSNALFGGLLFVIQSGNFTPELSIMIFYAQFAFLIGFAISFGFNIYRYLLIKKFTGE